jgi:hypothetical protein
VASSGEPGQIYLPGRVEDFARVAAGLVHVAVQIFPVHPRSDICVHGWLVRDGWHLDHRSHPGFLRKLNRASARLARQAAPGTLVGSWCQGGKLHAALRVGLLVLCHGRDWQRFWGLWDQCCGG